MTIYSATTIQITDSEDYLLSFIVSNNDDKSNKSLHILASILSKDWGLFVNFSIPLVTSYRDKKYTQLEIGFYQSGYVSFSVKECGEVVVTAVTNKLEFLEFLNEALSIAGNISE